MEGVSPQYQPRRKEGGKAFADEPSPISEHFEPSQPAPPVAFAELALGATANSAARAALSTGMTGKTARPRTMMACATTGHNGGRCRISKQPTWNFFARRTS